MTKKLKTMNRRHSRKSSRILYATVRKKDGQNYEPNSLRLMVTSIDCYLKEQGYKQFNSSKQVLEGKGQSAFTTAR